MREGMMGVRGDCKVSMQHYIRMQRAARVGVHPHNLSTCNLQSATYDASLPV